MKEILQQLLDGEISIERCETLLKANNILELDEIANFDADRKERTGFPEAILAESKSYDDLLNIVEKISANGLKENIIITRLSKERFDKLNQDLSYLSDEGIEFNYNKAAKTLVLHKGRLATLNPDLGKVGIITAGTSDIPVAEEARVILEQGGCETICSYDIGIAGIHRLFPKISHMVEEEVNVIVVCAGMEGALPSVVAGLVDIPVIGVPTSVGYGIGADGKAAVYSMLQSCAPGLSVVNIDNGFGAAIDALTIVQTIARNVEKAKNE
jgi:NCAIR mutase (PurE)-related protein